MNPLTSAYDLEARLQTELAQRDGTATEALIEQLRAPRKAVESFETVAAEIRADANLSEVGRQNRLDETRKKALESVERWHAEHVGALDAQITALGNSLAAKLAAAGPAPADAYVRLMADRLAAFDSVGPIKLYAEADPQTRRVMELASETTPVFPVRRSDGTVALERLLDEEQIANFRAARLRDVDPETTRKLRTLERRRGVLRALGRRARSLVRDGLR